MKGPKRKEGARYPSGQLRHVARTTGYHPRSIKSLVDAAIRGASDREYATPLGQMHLQGLFTSDEFTAGMRWDDLHRGFQVAIGSAKQGMGSPSLGDTRGSASVDPDSDQGKEQARRDRSAIRRFEEAHKVLVSAGMLSERAARQLCEGSGVRPIGHEGLLAAQRGLRALADHFRAERRILA